MLTNWWKRNFNFSHAGFTLVEILVAVLIMVLLITMAVPMYERTVEKSRVAEVSITLKAILESKLRTMDNKNITTFSSQFGLSELDASFKQSKDFNFSLSPGTYPNAVCASRSGGDNKGTLFLYLGETAAEYCSCPKSNTTTVCGAYCTNGRRLFCQNASGTSSCDDYGMPSFSIGTCK